MTLLAKEIMKNKRRQLFLSLNRRGLLKIMPDKMWIRLAWRIRIGKKINLDNPQTFNEKIQWLKLHDRKPEYTKMADKILAKKFVAEKIGEEYIIPTIEIWDDPEEIDFDALPEQFVIKCNHNSGEGMCICKDKSQLDINHVKKGLKKGLKEKYYIYSREWPYKNIPRKIFAEKYMKDTDRSNLIDYKFYCFEGEPRFLYVADANIVNNVKNDALSFFDLNWNFTKFQRSDHKQLGIEIKKPLNFEKMIEFSKLLSQNTHFLRVDWYEINGRLFFGEMTFSPGGGFGVFSPEKYEKIIGDWIKIPRKR